MRLFTFLPISWRRNGLCPFSKCCCQNCFPWGWKVNLCAVEEGTTEREYVDSYPSVNGFVPTLALLPTVLGQQDLALENSPESHRFHFLSQPLQPLGMKYWKKLKMSSAMTVTKAPLLPDPLPSAILMAPSCECNQPKHWLAITSSISLIRNDLFVIITFLTIHSYPPQPLLEIL